MKQMVALVLQSVVATAPSTAVAGGPASAVMYKDLRCEHRDGHPAALDAAGLSVRAMPINDLALGEGPSRSDRGNPRPRYDPVGGHAGEGHVPVAAMQRMISEKPAIRGIALPSMSSGSHGMAGPKTAPVRALSFCT